MQALGETEVHTYGELFEENLAVQQQLYDYSAGLLIRDLRDKTFNFNVDSLSAQLSHDVVDAAAYVVPLKSGTDILQNVYRNADDLTGEVTRQIDNTASSVDNLLNPSKVNLQGVADSIQSMLTGPALNRRVTTVTETADGKIVVSNTDGVPTPAQRAEANRIFGEGNVEFVSGGQTTNAAGSTGHHAEQRAIQYLGDDARGSTQASSHYSCDGCATAQSEAGINNITGNAADNGGKIGRPLEPIIE